MLKTGVAVLLALAALLTYAHLTVERASNGLLHDDIEAIPHRKTALVLGTSKKLPGNRYNLYFRHRIEAAALLFKSGKVDFLLLSGDNSEKYYDEPTTMKNDLVALGVPEEKIFLDYAGFRTLDSVVRSKTIFGQNQITVVSQPFHNKRALYIARKKGIDAIGFNAEDVHLSYGLRTQLREYLARVKMHWDLWTGKQPKYSGEPVVIE